MCTTLLLETNAYYHENRSNSFLLLLDASKAFDHGEYVKLFQQYAIEKFVLLY